MTVVKGETATVGDYKITFVQYDLSNMNSQSGKVSVGAELQVSHKGAEAVVLKPAYVVNTPNAPESRVALPGEQDAFLVIAGMNASAKTVDLHYHAPAQVNKDTEVAEPIPAIMFAEVSTKPGMLLLWVGVTLLMLGGAMSIYRRWPKTSSKSS